MSVEDIIDMNLSLRVSKVEFLAERVVLVNVAGILHPHVQLVSIHGVGDAVAQVLQLLHPWQRC